MAKRNISELDSVFQYRGEAPRNTYLLMDMTLKKGIYQLFPAGQYAGLPSGIHLPAFLIYFGHTEAGQLYGNFLLFDSFNGVYFSFNGLWLKTELST